jgi:uncharacterized protein YceH (UPF0502 family)
MTDDATSPAQEKPGPRWQPLPAIDRRVAGVLVEKAKTTPNAYPMSLNAIATACNQKSNRSPEMNLDPDDVEESLDRLRKLGAVGFVEGYGRVTKYRHYLYDWLGVDKVEIAVMAELLLRGEQTVGELRGRAARMEPIADLSALAPILQSLRSKGLVIALTPEGRGQVVAHALYLPGEMEKVKARYGAAVARAASSYDEVDPSPATSGPGAAAQAPGAAGDREIDELRSHVAQLRSDLEELAGVVERMEDELRSLRADLGG